MAWSIELFYERIKERKGRTKVTKGLNIEKMTHSLSPNNDEGRTTPPSPRKQKQKAKQKIEKKECQIEYMNENEAKEV